MSSDPHSGEQAPTSARGLARSFPAYEGQLTHVETVAAESGDFVDPHTALDPVLAAPFEEAVGDLYAHQATALRRLAAGENVCVSTSTSSGKTYVYALQIARNKLANPDATALLVYPTKALSRDQESELNGFFDDLGLDISVRVYDGDTPSDRRKHIRETADVVITNFAGVNVYLAHTTRAGARFWATAGCSRSTSHTRTPVSTGCTSPGPSGDCADCSPTTGATRGSSAPPPQSAIRRSTPSD
jgi:Distinct helicase family with a unique C-terminal domain including a metal-binding cysteine cluster